MQNTIEMITIDGLKIRHYPFINLIKFADLIYYDGPLLSWFKDEEGFNYLYVWRDNDAIHNRWLVFKVSYNDILKYIKGKISLLKLMKNPLDNILYFVDIEVDDDDNLLYKNTCIVTASIIPSKYLPKKDSFYEMEPIYYENFILPKEDDDEYTIRIDKDWSIDDLHSIPHTYSQTYGLIVKMSPYVCEYV